jgi:hypothetical protein
VQGVREAKDLRGENNANNNQNNNNNNQTNDNDIKIYNFHDNNIKTQTHHKDHPEIPRIIIPSARKTPRVNDTTTVDRHVAAKHGDIQLQILIRSLHRHVAKAKQHTRSAIDNGKIRESKHHERPALPERRCRDLYIVEEVRRDGEFKAHAVVSLCTGRINAILGLRNYANF